MAADVMGVPTLVIARTDAEAADLLTSDVDENDQPFCTGERTVEGLPVRNGLEQAIARAGLCAVRRPGVVRNRQAGPGLRQALRRSGARQVPGQDAGLQLLASFNWKKNLTTPPSPLPDRTGRDGLQVQFITLAGFHALNYGMFNLAHGYARRQMPAFVELQEAEFAAAERASPPSSTSAKWEPVISMRDPDVTVQSGQSSITAAWFDRRRAVLRKA
jgi:isocitrate lyase